MASKSTFITLALLLVLCMMLMKEASGPSLSIAFLCSVLFICISIYFACYVEFTEQIENGFFFLFYQAAMAVDLGVCMLMKLFPWRLKTERSTISVAISL